MMHYWNLLWDWNALDAVRTVHSAFELSALIFFALLVMFDVLAHLSDANKTLEKLLSATEKIFRLKRNSHSLSLNPTSARNRVRLYSLESCLWGSGISRSHERQTIPGGNVSCGRNRPTARRREPPERRLQPGLAAPQSRPICQSAAGLPTARQSALESAPKSRVSGECERCTQVPIGRPVRHDSIRVRIYEMVYLVRAISLVTSIRCRIS